MTMIIRIFTLCGMYILIFNRNTALKNITNQGNKSQSYRLQHYLHHQQVIRNTAQNKIYSRNEQSSILHQKQ